MVLLRSSCFVSDGTIISSGIVLLESWDCISLLASDANGALGTAVLVTTSGCCLVFNFFKESCVFKSKCCSFERQKNLNKIKILYVLFSVNMGYKLGPNHFYILTSLSIQTQSFFI